MSFRSFSLAAFCLALALSPSYAKAEGEMPGTLTGNLSFNTDYVYRGISQTANGPSVMGSLDWEFDTGYNDVAVYLGGFAANVDFPGSNANLEADLLAGVRGSVAEMDWDVGFTYYKYFGVTSDLNYDYYEFGAKASRDFGIVSLDGQISFSPDYASESGNEFYAGVRGEAPLPYEFSAFASLGHQWVEENNVAGIPDYFDWSIGLSRPLWKFTITAMYTDTDIKKTDCFAQDYGRVCDARGVVSLGFDF